jgi:disulfide bond formation protein DsbB
MASGQLAKAKPMQGKLTAVIRAHPPLAAAALVALGGAVTILGAWFFQLVIGLAPCPLCLEQRIPYYVGIPLAVILAFAALRGAPRGVMVAGLSALALIFLVSAALGFYHAGVEWKWWPGPQDCSGPLAPLGSAQDFLQRLQQVRVVRCDEIPWSFLGLSLAGYNALISLALAGIAIWGLRRGRPQRSGANAAYGSSSVSQ